MRHHPLRPHSWRIHANPYGSIQERAAFWDIHYGCLCHGAGLDAVGSVVLAQSGARVASRRSGDGVPHRGGFRSPPVGWWSGVKEAEIRYFATSPKRGRDLQATPCGSRCATVTESWPTKTRRDALAFERIRFRFDYMLQQANPVREWDY